MLNRVLSVAALLMMLISLTGCNSGSSKESAIVETKVNTEKSDKKAEKASADKNSGQQYAEETVKSVNIPLIENDDCRVIVTSIVPDYEFGYKLGLSLTNDNVVPLYFTTEKIAVDSMEITGYFGEKVLPGETRDSEIVFRKENCAVAENLSYSDICLSLKIYECDNPKEIYGEDIVHIYPEGEDNINKYKRISRKNDKVLIDRNGLKLTFINFDKDEYYAFANVYVENNSDKEVAFSCKDVSVNSNTVSTSFYATLLPGTSGYAKISWANSALEENDIDRVEDVKITIYARPVNSYDNIIEETFSL